MFSEILGLVLNLMKVMKLNFCAEFASIVANLQPERAPKIQQMFS
jgi:hypothetical protein